MTYGVGVDLGTTFTAAAVRRVDGQVEMTTLGRGGFAVPSALFALEEGGFLVGEVAMDRGRPDPSRLAVEFKRRLGDSAPILLGGTAYSADRLTAELLRWTLGVVAERQGAPADHVVVTCPANWGDFRRDMLRGALSLAGVPDATVITEPEGAALHYAAREGVEPGELVAVYDLGGGTFDAVVLERTDTGFVTRGTPHGIERLGGVDLDYIVRGMVIEHLTTDLTSLDMSDPSVAADLFDLQTQCVQAKVALSSDLATTVRVRLAAERADVRLTRAEFEHRAAPTLQASVEALEQTIRGAGATPADISKILLVGGSSRIPLISEMVFEALGRPVVVDTDPKAAVAMGAAHVATADPGDLVSPAVFAASGGELSSPPETLPSPPNPSAPPPETLPPPPDLPAPPPETLPPPPDLPAPPPETLPPPPPSGSPSSLLPETSPPLPESTPPGEDTVPPPGPATPVVAHEPAGPPLTPLSSGVGGDDGAAAVERRGFPLGARGLIGGLLVVVVLVAIMVFVARDGDPDDGDLAAENSEDEPEDETGQTPGVELSEFVDLRTAGEAAFPFGTEIGGQLFTSISGIAFDPNTGVHLGVRGNTNRPDPELADLEPVLYSFRTSATGDVQLIDAVSLTGPNGQPYGLELDAEGLEVLDDETVVVMSEGQPGGNAELFLHRHDREGVFLQSFTIPDTYVPTADRGIALGGFDSLSLVRGRDLLVAGIEYPLFQDDTPGALDDKTVRLLGFDTESGDAIREWGYPLDNVNPDHPDPSAVRGAVLDLISVDDRTMLVWERSFALPRGEDPIFALYQIELTEGVEPSEELPPVLEKTLVWADTGGELTENYDSASLGVVTDEGETTIVLASDCRYRVCDTSILTLALDERG